MGAVVVRNVACMAGVLLAMLAVFVLMDFYDIIYWKRPQQHQHQLQLDPKKNAIESRWETQKKTTTTTTTEATPVSLSSSRIKPVHWKVDNQWFDKVARSGRCPYDVWDVERSCTQKLHLIEPLRPMGGFSNWTELLRQKQQASASSSTSLNILVQGDSLAKQHFISLLCLDWYKYPGNPQWKVVSKKSNDVKAILATHVQHPKITVELFRWTEPTSCPPERCLGLNYRKPDVVILGGWHHGGLEQPNAVANLVQYVQAKRQGVHANATVIVTQDFPRHWPGNSGWNSQSFPVANLRIPPDTTNWLQTRPQNPNASLYACDSYSNTNSPQFNHFLPTWVESTGGRILKIAHLYQARGQAHVGHLSPKEGMPRRDCLHWCTAPGVLDAMALATLAEMIDIFEISANVTKNPS